MYDCAVLTLSFADKHLLQTRYLEFLHTRKMGKTQLATYIGFVSVVFASIIIAQDQLLPVLETVPQTQFSCKDKVYGYYADLEANCQAFHVCLNGQKWSFLCPNQTQFNQHYLVCDYPGNIDCTQSDSFLYVNDYFGRTDKNFLA